ncbi:MAG: hypothetical protein QM755_24500 [Luteolibacter sp.]
MTDDDPWGTRFRFSTRFGFRLFIRRLLTCVVLGLLGLVLLFLVCVLLPLFNLNAGWPCLILIFGVVAMAVFTLIHSLQITTEDGILTKRLEVFGLPLRTRRIPFQTVEVIYDQPPTIHNSDGPTESSGRYKVYAVMNGSRRTVLTSVETYLNGFECDRWEWHA